MKQFTLKRATSKFDVAKRLRTLMFVFLLIMTCAKMSAQQPNSFILAIPGQNLNFLNANRTLISNNGNNGLSAGSV